MHLIFSEKVEPENEKWAINAVYSRVRGLCWTLCKFDYLLTRDPLLSYGYRAGSHMWLMWWEVWHAMLTSPTAVDTTATGLTDQIFWFLTGTFHKETPIMKWNAPHSLVEENCQFFVSFQSYILVLFLQREKQPCTFYFFIFALFFHKKSFYFVNKVSMSKPCQNTSKNLGKIKINLVMRASTVSYKRTPDASTRKCAKLWEICYNT